MKLYFSSILLITLISGSILVTTQAMADNRDHHRNGRDFSSFSRNQNFDNRGRTAFQPARIQGYDNRNSYNRNSYNRGSSSNWSVGISLNSGWPGYYNQPFNRPFYQPFRNTYFGTFPVIQGSYTTVPGLGIVSTRNRAPVIVEHNTYINSSPVVYPGSTTYYDSTSGYSSTVRSTVRSTVAPAGISLLKDRYGRCYERSRDERGNEIRIELSASACNY